MPAKPSILYVEDEARSRRVMRLLLQNSMKLEHVTIFEDSSNFMERAKAVTPKPDIIFLDIHIAPHNGFQMLDMIRNSQYFKDQIVIALTASVMNEEVRKLQQAGFNGCLAKPIDMDVFPDLLARMVQGEAIWHITA